MENSMPTAVAAGLGAHPRILVARLDSIGDCAVSAGCFIGLRALFPAAHITAVFRQETAPLEKSSALFDAIVGVTGKAGWATGMLSPAYDLAICRRWDDAEVSSGHVQRVATG
jgi:hypothetical protein